MSGAALRRETRFEPGERCWLGRMIVYGPAGAVELVVEMMFVTAHAYQDGSVSRLDFSVKGDGVHVHRALPDDADEFSSAADNHGCDVLATGRCWFEGGGYSYSTQLVDRLTRLPEKVWVELEERYRTTFEGAPSSV